MTKIKYQACQHQVCRYIYFFRLPIVKDLSKLDYCFCGVPWDGGTTNSQVQDMALELEMPHH